MSKKNAGRDASSTSLETSAVLSYGWKLDTASTAEQIARIYIQEHSEYAELTVEIALYVLHTTCVASAKGASIDLDSLPNLLSSPEITLSDALLEELEMLQAIYADQCSYVIADGSIVSVFLLFNE